MTAKTITAKADLALDEERKMSVPKMDSKSGLVETAEAAGTGTGQTGKVEEPDFDRTQSIDNVTQARISSAQVLDDNSQILISAGDTQSMSQNPMLDSNANVGQPTMPVEAYNDVTNDYEGNKV